VTTAELHVVLDQMLSPGPQMPSTGELLSRTRMIAYIYKYWSYWQLTLHCSTWSRTIDHVRSLWLQIMSVLIVTYWLYLTYYCMIRIIIIIIIIIIRPGKKSYYYYHRFLFFIFVVSFCLFADLATKTNSCFERFSYKFDVTFLVYIFPFPAPCTALW